ncbi:MAG: formylglycine-generating enzyme family protein [Bacteroidales bacterium]|nr:formylglycine-generating enzyme family protein [Bacteroidales bacterium]
MMLLVGSMLLATFQGCKKDDENGNNGGNDTPKMFEDFTVTINDVTFEMIAVEGGTFMMGSQNTDPSGANYDEEAFDNESPVHQVTLSDFYIEKYEVTQAQWRAIIGDNPSYFSGCDDCPVEQVSWNDIQDFLQKLNALTGKNFVLPTEAQWEFAARGGNKSNGYKYSGSNTLGNVGWYYYNSGSTTHRVGQKIPNELGIYDLSGNVWEVCQDWKGSYSSGSQTNPTGPALGSFRVLRGGSWCNSAMGCRVSCRFSHASSFYDTGFRVALLH